MLGTATEDSLRDHYWSHLSDLKLPPGTKDIFWGAALTVGALGGLLAGGPVVVAFELELGGALSWGLGQFGVGIGEAAAHQEYPEAIESAHSVVEAAHNLADAQHYLLAPEDARELDRLKAELGILEHLAETLGVRSRSNADDAASKSDAVKTSDDKSETPPTQRNEESDDQL